MHSPRALPEPLVALSRLALDLHWSWNHAGDALWKQVDADLWERTQNPWLVLQYASPERLERLAADPAFLRDVEALQAGEAAYRSGPRWRPTDVSDLPGVAYFSMEFGLHEALPLYAGGLGILAGDHLKTASDLGVPVIGIGILWDQGYFRQVLDAGGGQTEFYPFNEPAALPIEPAFGPLERLSVSIDLPGRTILLRVWQATVGRTMLYLLDSNHPFNAPADRGLTSALYGGEADARLMQCIVLGVGGWRLIEALGLNIEICHLNEGHAAFVVVERARAFMARQGTTFAEALWATRAGNVFTTHTAVPAGFDVFQVGEIARYRAYFEEYVRQLGLTWPELLSLGRSRADAADEGFNMAWLAVRGCGTVNAVSQLHGAVSRRLFGHLFPRRPEHEVPIGAITNGVHVPSWDSPWTDTLWTRAAGKARWRGDVSALTEAARTLTDEELWLLRSHERRDLVRYARERLAQHLARRLASREAQVAAGDMLHPDWLTLGFARRFARYKRPNLLLTDPDRFGRILARADRPVQLIVAGKAHPRDAEAKRLIAEWVAFAERPGVRGHVVFLEDYDMRLATELVQGVDVWINTPRRPWEACGTSGMKVLVNGGLNVSVLDGWWAEAFDPACGWAIGDGLEHLDERADVQDADALYALLEDEIAGCFYDRDGNGLPRRWLAMMRSSMAALTPRFSSVRMLQEYVEHAYVPAAAAYRRRVSDRHRLAGELHRWHQRLERHWSEIRFGDMSLAAEGGRVSCAVRVHLGSVEPDAVRVELYAEPSDAAPAIRVVMVPTGTGAELGSGIVYCVAVETSRPASDFTPRVVPFHPEAHVPLESALIAWQR